MSDDATVSQLMSMGFTRERVVHALEASCYNPDKAAGFLLSDGAPHINGAGKEKVPMEVLWTNRGNTSLSSDERIFLMLIGKTGNGKSSTGNSLVLRDDFAEGDGGESETFDVKIGSTFCNGETLSIIDTPGLKDTRGMGAGEAMEKVVSDMKSSMGLCPVGVDCVILVLRYGVRFTPEDQSTVDNLMRIFGKVIFEKYCIVLFTHGDTFQKKQNRSEQPETYEQWYKRQGGGLGDLLKMCHDRVIFFDNDTPTEEQRVQLVQMVQRMKLRGDRYNNNLFAEAVAEQKKLVEEANLPMITTQVMEEITLLREELGRVLKTKDKTNLLIQLDVLKERARTLLADINNLDYAQGVLDDIKATVTDFVENVGSRAEAENTAAKLDDQNSQLRRNVFKAIAVVGGGGGASAIGGRAAMALASDGRLGVAAAANPAGAAVIAGGTAAVAGSVLTGSLLAVFVKETGQQWIRDRARKKAQHQRQQQHRHQRVDKFEKFRH